MMMMMMMMMMMITIIMMIIMINQYTNKQTKIQIMSICVCTHHILHLPPSMVLLSDIFLKYYILFSTTYSSVLCIRRYRLCTCTSSCGVARITTAAQWAWSCLVSAACCKAGMPTRNLTARHGRPPCAHYQITPTFALYTEKILRLLIWRFRK